MSHQHHCEARAQSNGKETVAFIALKSQHVLTGLFLGGKKCDLVENKDLSAAAFRHPTPHPSFPSYIYYIISLRRCDNLFVRILKTESTWKQPKVIFTSALLLFRFQKQVRLLKFWGRTVWMCLRKAPWELSCSASVSQSSTSAVSSAWEPVSPLGRHHHVIPRLEWPDPNKPNVRQRVSLCGIMSYTISIRGATISHCSQHKSLTKSAANKFNCRQFLGYIIVLVYNAVELNQTSFFQSWWK